MNKKELSERDICTKFITPSLRKAGWNEITQLRDEVSFHEGPDHCSRQARHARKSQTRLHEALADTNREVQGSTFKVRGSSAENLMAIGITVAQVVEELPDLEEEDVRQALAYAAALAQDERHPLRG